VHALNGAELDLIERTFLPLQSRVHSRAGRRFAFLLTSKRLPVATINAIVQRLIPPPKYHVERLVPGVALGREARVAGMFVIERSDVNSFRELAADEALEILLANCDDAYGFPPYETLERLLLSISDMDLRAEEQAIVRGALEDRDTMLIRSNRMGWADVIAATVEAAHTVNGMAVASFVADGNGNGNGTNGNGTNGNGANGHAHQDEVSHG
jgi:hypothetical protein